MTCIVAIEHEDCVYVGGDSLGTDPAEHHHLTRADEKVFINNEFIIGMAGSFRVGQLMRYAFDPPEQPSKKDTMAFMVTDVIDAIRNVQREKGSLKKENEEEESVADLIIGYRGKIYLIEADFQVGRPRDNYAAIGNGTQVALGVLYATKHYEDPIARITLALDAACEYATGVRGPYTIMKLKSGDTSE